MAPAKWAEPLRGVLDEWAELSSRQVRKGTGLYDELSRLNNELLNLQRELARKNAELEAMRDAPSDLPSRGA